MTCKECTTSLQLVVHKVYVEGCLGCGIRKLAYMDSMERQEALDRIQFVHGQLARSEAVRMTREEVARIAALKKVM